MMKKTEILSYRLLDDFLTRALRVFPLTSSSEKIALWWGYRYRPAPSIIKLRSGALMRTTHVDHLQLLLYYTGTFEPHALQAMRDHVRKGDTILDVGANIGLFTVEGALAVGPSGRIIAIEAAPHHAKTVQEVASLNGLHNVEIVSTAVGDAPGEATLTLPKNSNFGMFTLGNVEGDEKFVVPIRTIDEILFGQKIDFIKMDIEGYEYRALLGARNTIETYHPTILIELNESALQACGTSSRAVKTLLAQYGYSGTFTDGNPIALDMPHVCEECVFKYVAGG